MSKDTRVVKEPKTAADHVDEMYSGLLEPADPHNAGMASVASMEDPGDTESLGAPWEEEVTELADPEFVSSSEDSEASDDEGWHFATKNPEVWSIDSHDTSIDTVSLLTDYGPTDHPRDITDARSSDAFSLADPGLSGLLGSLSTSLDGSVLDLPLDVECGTRGCWRDSHRSSTHSDQPPEEVDLPMPDWTAMNSVSKSRIQKYKNPVSSPSQGASSLKYAAPAPSGPGLFTPDSPSPGELSSGSSANAIGSPNSLMFHDVEELCLELQQKLPPAGSTEHHSGQGRAAGQGPGATQGDHSW